MNLRDVELLRALSGHDTRSLQWRSLKDAYGLPSSSNEYKQVTMDQANSFSKNFNLSAPVAVKFISIKGLQMSMAKCFHNCDQVQQKCGGELVPGLSLWSTKQINTIAVEVHCCWQKGKQLYDVSPDAWGNKHPLVFVPYAKLPFILSMTKNNYLRKGYDHALCFHT